jgi:hypothetical protein
MNPTVPRLLRFVSAALVHLAAGALLHAGPWEPLFNGRDLSGWKQINGTAAYKVVDGAVVGTTVMGSPNSFLATEKTYGDFILELEIRQDIGPTNSGIQFRSLSKPEVNDGRVHGYQFEIDPSDRAWTGGIYDEARRGWLFPGTLNPSSRGLYRYQEWNRIRIEAIGSTLRTWVNGTPVAHVVDDLTARGFIALQVHSIREADHAGRKISWRNIRIQTTDLEPSPPDDVFIRNVIPNQVSAAEQRQGWRNLWDGRTTDGWRGARKDAFPESGWEIGNGELKVLKSDGAESKNGGDIVTVDEFSAFELQVEFKLTAGANSGIKYYVIEDLTPIGGSAIGLEFQLLDDEKHPDAKQGVAGNRTLASLYDLIPRNQLPGGLAIVPRIGEWQHARIVARSNREVEHWLNGIKVVEYVRGSPAFREMVARSKYAKLPAFGEAASGRILLQDHGDEVHFRSIKLRPLP